MGISKHREESLKYDVQQHIFDEIHIVGIADETLSQIMFDIPSQSTQKLRSKHKSKILKVYANYFKTRYPDLLHSCDFVCFNLMNY